MPQIKSSKDIASKWSRVTQQRTTDYVAGVKAPRVDWATATAGAEDNYRAGVTAAANRGSFGKGVVASGTKKWQDKTQSIGAGRWPSGVAVAQGDFEAGFAPFAEVISRTTLSPRYPKGDPRNYARVSEIGNALNAAKVGK